MFIKGYFRPGLLHHDQIIINDFTAAEADFCKRLQHFGWICNQPHIYPISDLFAGFTKSSVSLKFAKSDSYSLRAALRCSLQRSIHGLRNALCEKESIR